MIIRKAVINDIDDILRLLSQVLEIHATIRPDIFVSGETKYTREELVQKIINNDELIYVSTIDDKVVGYAFCELKYPHFTSTMIPNTYLYIDDFCIDERYRNKHIGKELFEYIKKLAKELGCYEICLSQWEGNIGAEEFYKKMGMKRKYVMMEYIIDE